MTKAPVILNEVKNLRPLNSEILRSAQDDKGKGPRMTKEKAQDDNKKAPPYIIDPAMLTLLLIYILVGSAAGMLAGLFGIGGGLVIVPMLDLCFTRSSFTHEHIMHLALGTSMASIIFTSVSSLRAHHERGAVNWTVVRRITPGIIAGTLLGSFIAARMSTGSLKGFFALFLYYVALQMILDRKPEPSREFPGPAGMFSAGSVIGAISSLAGIGGGTMSVPFMVWCNLAIHHAVGTSAAIGFPIAVAGTAGYIINGLNASGLPDHAFGYIYLPALFGIVLASVLTAPIGARLAHSLPVPRLKRYFAILLLVVGTRMLLTLISS